MARLAEQETGHESSHSLLPLHSVRRYGRTLRTSPIIVLGAGPAGIGAALALGPDATVFERGERAGGLSQSIEIDGAVFDFGGHSFHTPHQHVRDLVFGALEMEEQRRQAWCWTKGDWVEYPFQKHVASITDPAVRAACIAGMATAGDGSDAADFDAFIDRRFGRATAEAFMRPYNRKLWGEDLSRLATAWADERVAAPSGHCEEFKKQGGKRTPLQADTRIAYPRRGGFGAIFDALAEKVSDLRLRTGVVSIDPDARTFMTSDGATGGWDTLISTISLPALLTLVGGVPQTMRDAVRRLEAIPVDLVMVVLAGRGRTDLQRVYCPDADMPGHKIVLNHTSSHWLRQLPRHGIQVEVSAAREHGNELVGRVIGDLLRLGLLASPDEVRHARRLRLVQGYPVPTHDRNSIIREVRAWLADRRIHICGRFAEWAYVNADDALARGLSLGRSLSAGTLAERA